ncbi:HNH endonuclease family protein [Streptomyces sp. XM4011]|uniref:HNH endonuclease family protein n=1 Tax=Streptomyces sp. XM4011 TaxID=2929780 RepID=UPI001FF70605|nr:HNH endonuclease family protein [Streptomyces sp. XM4011]MCK1817386.1 HNH endonuclease family protein [Streptomyces sp. XM4011]
MKTLFRAAFAGAATVALLIAPAPAHAAQEVTLPLSEAITSLPVQDEDRTGYNRDLFKHWIDEDKDGCSTRAEVLLDEAVVAPTITGKCTLSGGQWYSYYDERTIDGPSGLDIDHVVPLAEAWDSGASEWDSGRRERYANDLGDPRSLIAVSGSSNRSKGDKDPQDWMPPAESAHCRYVEEWTVVKVRWQLAVDEVELAALQDVAAGCEDVAITVQLAD